MNEKPDQTIPVVEEHASLGRRRVETGRVRIRTETERESTTVSGELEGETVEIERVPVGAEIETIPEVTTRGDVTIVPVVEEVLVVEKRLVLKEEVHIRRRRTHESVEAPVTLHHQRAHVERLPAEATTETPPDKE